MISLLMHLISKISIKWIMDNIKESMYNENRSYIYNKAFARWFDNNDVYNHHGLDNAKQMNLVDQYNGKCKAGALSPTGIRQEEKCPNCNCMSQFDLIREWAYERGLYDKGDPKTQYLKLSEEVGELGRALLKKDHPEQIDAIGDIVVVLTNLSELIGVMIEDCIDTAYNVIAERKGKMINGTFVKDE